MPRAKRKPVVFQKQGLPKLRPYTADEIEQKQRKIIEEIQHQREQGIEANIGHGFIARMTGV